MRDGLPIEVLVEVIAAHDSQSLDGTPETRCSSLQSSEFVLAIGAEFGSDYLPMWRFPS